MNITKPSIINLSTYKLTTEQIDILKLGLKFCPTPKSNITELKGDLKEFERKFRLLEMFHNTDAKDNSLVKNKSNFHPNKGLNKDLDAFFDKLGNIDLKENKNVKNNLSHEQQKALEELKNNSEIVIKEADKGSAIVIMDREYYKEKIQTMLEDPQSYRPIDKNIDKKTMSKISELCEKNNTVLTKKEVEFLTNFSPRTSNLYGLPKIHKSEEIKNSIRTQKSEYVETHNPKDLKFRPIVAGPICPTSRLSNLIDILLQPFLRKVKSYVRDDIHFLNLLPETADPNTLLTTYDITNLYNNIPHDLGKQAIRYWIEKHPDILPSRFKEEFIIDSIDIILTNNSFQFNDVNYIQNTGTAMGTKMAPAYATLTLAFLEETLYKKIENKYGIEIQQKFMNTWWRYLDDCFILWENEWGNVEEFFSILQNLHPDIKFTMEQNHKEIPFLDILIKNENGKITTDIYRKPTDSQRYLHFMSHHPKNCKKSIPFILARRVCTIVSDTVLRNERLKELHDTLTLRGYPTPLIDKGIDMAKKIPLSQLRTQIIKQGPPPLTFVTTFNKRNPQIFPEIHKHLQTLQQNTSMKELLNGTKIIKSERQCNNFKQILTSAKFGTRPTNGAFKCNKPRCGTCNIIKEGNLYTFQDKTTFEIRRHLTCESQNVVYVLECQKCHENYIGSTTLTLTRRMTLHRSQIKNEQYRILSVSQHLHSCSDGNFFVLPILQAKNETLLLLQEERLISSIKPKLNNKQLNN